MRDLDSVRARVRNNWYGDTSFTGSFPENFAGHEAERFRNAFRMARQDARDLLEAFEASLDPTTGKPIR